MRYRSILVYVDTRLLGDVDHAHEALENVARLALAHDAAFTLCDVVASPPRESRPGPASRLGLLRLRYAEDILKRLAGGLTRLIESKQVVLEGNAFLALTRHVMQQRVDLVVTPCFTETSARQAAVAAHLVRKCPTTVWDCRVRGRASRARLAVALDRELFAGTELPQTMAGRLLDTAVALARGQTAEIHLVHAWEVYGAELLEQPSIWSSDDDAARYVDGQRYSHTLWLEEMLALLRERASAAGLTQWQSTAHLIEGPPETAIPAWLETADIDALVIGNAGVSSAGLFIGNTAESLLTRSPVPVVAVKPFDFRSPVPPR